MPISLIVTLETVKLIQGIIISIDENLKCQDFLSFIHVMGYKNVR